MSFRHNNAPHRNNTQNWFEAKFNNLKYTILRKYRYNRNNQSEKDKQIEINAIHLIKEIEDYGFNFFAEHYLWEKMRELENLAKHFR